MQGETDCVTSVRAELDLPGETGRQTRIFAIWVLCLVVAVIVGSLVDARVPLDAEGSDFARRELSRGRASRAKVGLLVGLVLPVLLTWGIHVRYRRGGAHARGIFVDVTSTGELRVWGRGYGVRVALKEAVVSERLVDIYAGRLGAWRQRRLRVRGKVGMTAGREIEIATLAVAGDLDAGLRVESGEGDCVELSREDFEVVRQQVTSLSG